MRDTCTRCSFDLLSEKMVVAVDVLPVTTIIVYYCMNCGNKRVEIYWTDEIGEELIEMVQTVDPSDDIICSNTSGEVDKLIESTIQILRHKGHAHGV